LYHRYLYRSITFNGCNVVLYHSRGGVKKQDDDDMTWKHDKFQGKCMYICEYLV